MRLYNADFSTYIPAAILEYTSAGYASRTETFSETGSALGVHELLLDYIPKQDGVFSFTENAVPCTVIPWAETPSAAHQVSVDFETGKVKLYGNLFTLSCTYTPLGSCLTAPLASWIKSAAQAGFQHSTAQGNFHGVSLQDLTAQQWNYTAAYGLANASKVIRFTDDDFIFCDEITASALNGTLYGTWDGVSKSALQGVQSSVSIGSTSGTASYQKLNTLTTYPNFNISGKTSMQGASFYQSPESVGAEGSAYYYLKCSLQGVPTIESKSTTSTAAIDFGTVRTQKLLGSIGTYGEWTEYPYRNGSQTALSGPMQLVSGTTPYMTIPAAQIEKGAQFRITGFFKRSQITTNYTGGGGLRIVSSVGSGYTQPKNLTLTTQTSLFFAVDIVLTAVDNGSNSWQLLQSQDAMLNTSYISGDTVITVPKNTDVPLYLWTSTANTVTLGTDYKDFIGGFQLYRLR